jgi:hypothetical protein
VEGLPPDVRRAQLGDDGSWVFTSAIESVEVQGWYALSLQQGPSGGPFTVHLAPTTGGGLPLDAWGGTIWSYADGWTWTSVACPPGGS